MSRYDDINANLKEMCEATGQTFSWKTLQDLPAVIDRVARGNLPMEGGQWPIYNGALTTSYSYFPDGIPAKGDKITINEQSLFVHLVKADPDQPPIRIEFANNPPPK